ncbi:MAG: hypothetical protein L3K26_16710, partial [Candidatus Hydrogenedentes bacterium]|nr:hypothetical protein [Candidatus Hydrogenedentota bacterium]
MQSTSCFPEGWIKIFATYYVARAFTMLFLAALILFLAFSGPPPSMLTGLSCIGIACLPLADMIRQCYRYRNDISRGRLRRKACFDGEELTIQQPGKPTLVVRREECRTYYPFRDMFVLRDGTRIPVRATRPSKFHRISTSLARGVFSTWWPDIDLENAWKRASQQQWRERIAIDLVWLLVFVLPAILLFVADLVERPDWVDGLVQAGWVAPSFLLWLVLFWGITVWERRLKNQEVIELPGTTTPKTELMGARHVGL